MRQLLGALPSILTGALFLDLSVGDCRPQILWFYPQSPLSGDTMIQTNSALPNLARELFRVDQIFHPKGGPRAVNFFLIHTHTI